MKTIKFKFLLPAAVFMVAIAAAFATQKNAEEAFAPVQGYIYQNGVCVKHGTCDNTSAPLICTDNLGRQVFGKNGTNCINLLYMNWSPQNP